MNLSVLTPKEVADALKVDEEVILELMDRGELRGFQAGHLWRTTQQFVEQFIQDQTKPEPQHVKANQSDSRPEQADEKMGDLRSGWDRIDGGFRFGWPNMDEEVFDVAFARIVRRKGRNIPLVIGIGDRRAAGRVRRRAVVFWGVHPGTKSPLVEFAGANDFDDTKLMASVIKVDGRRHLAPADDLPEQYVDADLPIGVYNHVVTGPRAWDSQAVLAREDQLEVMATHALIRAQQKGLL
ncbi:MAG: helix-turn-helix domain-containing protein [Armatimonadia bacterium]